MNTSSIPNNNKKSPSINPKISNKNPSNMNPSTNELINPNKNVSSTIKSNTSNINPSIGNKNIPKTSNINPTLVDPSLIPQVKKTLPPLQPDNSILNPNIENLKNTQILNPSVNPSVINNKSNIKNSLPPMQNSFSMSGFNNSENDNSFQPPNIKDKNNPSLSKISENNSESIINSKINNSGFDPKDFRNDSNIKSGNDLIQNSKFDNNDDKQSEMSEPQFLNPNLKYSNNNQEEKPNYDSEYIPENEYHNPSIYYQSNIKNSKMDLLPQNSKIKQSTNPKIKNSKINNEKEDEKEVTKSNIKGSQKTNNNVESIIENDSFYNNISVFNKIHKGKQNFRDSSYYQIRNVNYDEDVDMIDDKLCVDKVLMDSNLDQSKVLEERKKYIEEQKKQRKKDIDNDEY